LHLQATAEANNLTAVAEAKDLYLQMMETVCGGAKPFLATAHLESEHQHCMDSALRQFQNKRKMGGEEFSQIYMEKLIKANTHILIKYCSFLIFFFNIYFIINYFPFAI